MALREILARFGFELDDAKLKKADAGIEGVLGKMKAFGEAIAGTAIVRGIGRFVGDMIEMGDELGANAEKLGMGVDALFSWQAAAKGANVDAGKLNIGFRTLAKNAEAAQTAGSEQAKAFDELGVQTKNADGSIRPLGDLMRETGLAIGAMDDKTKRLAVAQKLLGKSGGDLIPLFAEGEEALDAALGTLDRYGVSLEEFVAKAQEADDAQNELNTGWLIMKTQIATVLLPWVTAAMQKMSQWGAAISKFLGSGKRLQAIIAAIGAAMVRVGIAKFGGSLYALAKAALGPAIKLAALYLILNDLMVFFAGGDSLIGRGLDALFGKGTQSKVRDALKDIWKELTEHDWAGAAKKVADGLDQVGEAIVEKVAGGDLDSMVASHMEDTGEGWGTILIKGIATGFVDAGTAIFDNIVTTMSRGAARIAEAASEWAAAGAELVKSLIEGMVNGIVDGAASVVDAVKEHLGFGVVNELKKAWKPGSPSKVSYELAATLPAGSIKALDAWRGKVAAASARMGQATVSGLARGQGRGAGGGSTQNLFKSDTRISVSGSPSDAQIGKLRQVQRQLYAENRAATLAALTEEAAAVA